MNIENTGYHSVENKNSSDEKIKSKLKPLTNEELNAVNPSRNNRKKTTPK